MPAEQFANRASSTLASGIAIGAVSLTVAAGHGAKFSAAGDFSVVLESASDPNVWEVVKCTARAGDVLTITATTMAWAAGTKVGQILDKRILDLLLQAGKAQTVTEDLTIEEENHVLLGDSGSVGSHASKTVYFARNAKRVGGVWVRTLADNDALLLESDSTGDLFIYTNTDAGNTVGSAITWSTRIHMSKAGLLTGAVMDRIQDSGFLGGDTAGIDFTNIPGTYLGLLLVYRLNSTHLGSPGTELFIRFNDDAGSSYRGVRTSNISGTVSGVALDPVTAIKPGLVPESTIPSNPAHGRVLIPYYIADANANTPHILWEHYNYPNRAFYSGASNWGGTGAPITKIRLAPENGSFKAGSRATLYGLR